MATKDPLGKWDKDDGKEVYTKKGLIDSLSAEAKLDNGQKSIAEKIQKLKKELNTPQKSGAKRVDIVKELSEASKSLAKAKKEAESLKRQGKSTEAVQRDLVSRLNLINKELASRKGKQKNDLSSALDSTGLDSKLKDLLRQVLSKSIDDRHLVASLNSINEDTAKLPLFIRNGFTQITKDNKDAEVSQQEAYNKILAQNAQIRDMFKRTGGSILSGLGKVGLGILDRLGPKGMTIGGGVRNVGKGFKAVGRAYTGTKEAYHSVANTFIKTKTFLEERSAAKSSVSSVSKKSDGNKSQAAEIRKYADKTSVFNKRMLKATEKIANKKDGDSGMLGGMISSIMTFFSPGGFIKTISDLISPIGSVLGMLGRVVGGAAGVGLAGYLGFKAGEWLNEKFGLSDKLVAFAEFMRDKAIPAVVNTAESAHNGVKSAYNATVDYASRGIETGVNAVSKGVDTAKSGYEFVKNSITTAVTDSNTYKETSAAINSGGSPSSVLSSVASGVSNDAQALGSSVKSGVVSLGSKLSDVLGKYVTTSGSADINGLQPSLQTNVSNMAKEYFEATGKKLDIVSGHRSNEKQAQLYRTLPKGQAAPPGRSLHNFGLALDVDKAQANELAKMGLLEKYGLTRPLLNAKIPEAWHLQPKGLSVAAAKAGIFSGEASVNQTPVPSAGAVTSNNEAIASTSAEASMVSKATASTGTSSASASSSKDTYGQNTKTSVNDIPLVDPSDGFLNALNVGVL